MAATIHHRDANMGCCAVWFVLTALFAISPSADAEDSPWQAGAVSVAFDTAVPGDGLGPLDRTTAGYDLRGSGHSWRPADRPGADLRQWLKGLRIELPAFTLPFWLLAHLGISVHVAGGTCEGLEIGEVVVPKAEGALEVLQLGLRVSGAAVQCRLDADLATPFGRAPLAQVIVSVEASGADVVVAISTDGTEAPLPQEVKLESCQLAFHMASLHFKGAGFLAATLEAMVPLIRMALEGGVRMSFCPKLAEVFHTTAAESLAWLSKELKPLLRPAAPLPWQRAANSADISELLWHGPLGRCIRAFLREQVKVDDPALFNEFLRRTLSSLGLVDASSRWRLQPKAGEELLHRSLSVPFTNGTVSLSAVLHQVSVGALDSVDHMGSAVDHNTVTMSGAFSPDIAVGGAVTMQLTRGVGQVQVAGLTFKLEEAEPLDRVRLSMSLQAGLGGRFRAAGGFDPVQSAAFQLDQWQHASCLPHVLLPRSGLTDKLWPAVRPHSLSLGLLEARAVPATVLAMATTLEDEPEETLEAQLLEVTARILGAANATFGTTGVRLLDGVISGPGRDAADALLERVLLSGAPCPASNFTDGHYPAVDYPARGGATVAFFAAALVLIKACWARRGPPSPSERPLGRHCEAELRAQPPAQDAGGILDLRNQASGPQATALCAHAGLPRGLQLAVPLLIFGNVCLFIIASVTPGIGVAARALIDGEMWAFPGIANLSIDNTISQMWTTHAYPLCVAVVLFTVVWPYAKLVLMLHAWLRPYSDERRGQLLVFLDQVGKWSLTDNFVMMLLINFFYVSWNGRDVEHPGSHARVELVCVPGLEFHVFILATVFSLGLGHAVLAAHRFTQGAFDLKISDRVSRPLWCTALSHRTPLVRHAMGVACALAVLATMALIIAAWLSPMAFLEFGGVVGTFLDVTGQPQGTVHSLASIAMKLVAEHDAYLAVVLVLFAGLLPMVLLVALLLLWLAPLGNRARLVLLTVSQMLAAWSSLDVAVVAVLAAVFGGESFGISQFMELVIYSGTVAPLCNELLESTGIYCLTVRLEIMSGMWVLVAAAVATLMVSHCIFRAVLVETRTTSAGCSLEQV